MVIYKDPKLKQEFSETSCDNENSVVSNIGFCKTTYTFQKSYSFLSEKQYNEGKKHYENVCSTYDTDFYICYDWIYLKNGCAFHVKEN